MEIDLSNTYIDSTPKNVIAHTEKAKRNSTNRINEINKRFESISKDSYYDIASLMGDARRNRV